MNKPFLTILLAYGLLLLSACSTTNNAITFTPSAAEPDQATLYIYRPDKMTNALYSPGINIDGEFRLYTKNGVNSRLLLPAGEHIVEIQPERRYSELTPLALELKAGAIYFVRVSTSLKISNNASYQPYARSFILSLVDEVLAVKEIAACCLNNSDKTSQQAETKATDKKSNGGFSVDKTQNPFSH